MDVNVGEIRMTPEEPFQEAKASVDLTKSGIIVAVGRGIKSQENIALAQQLADALGADLAASRPICDAEWLPIDRQIGSSGQTVAPKLYIALGISGAIQHIVGMKNAGTIVAVNKDAEAPIFDIADYGIVGDLFEAVPVMIEEVKKAKALGNCCVKRVGRCSFFRSEHRPNSFGRNMPERGPYFNRIGNSIILSA